MRTVLVLPILCLAAAAAFAEDPLVVIAANRAGRIHIYDQALNHEGTIGVNPMLESVSPSPDGHKLYLVQESRGECCGVYTLVMENLHMCSAGWPVMAAVASPDGHGVFVQGKDYASSYDTEVSWRTPNLKGVYNLQPSPNGNWLLAIANTPKPVVVVADMKGNKPQRTIEIPIGPATGAWAGNTFYLFAYAAPGTGRLWKVDPEEARLTDPKDLPLPDLHGDCDRPVPLMVMGAPDKLLLAEVFGQKLDRRSACPDAATDGIYGFQASTARPAFAAPGVHVNRMAVTRDGKDIFVISSDSAEHRGELRLMHIDGHSGRIGNSATLEPGEWNLAVTRMPAAFIPHGYVRAAISCAR